jgi:hypothetical protein
MDHVLSSALRDATSGWLSRLETLVRDADVTSRAALAQTEMVRMVIAWRSLLAEHEPDEEGRCRRCAGWRRRRPYPCSVWVSAHRYLVVDDAPGSGIARHAMASRQQRAQ